MPARRQDLSESEIDATLAAAVGRGDYEALGGLYSRHAATVFSALLRSGASPQRARAALREAFLALWRRARSADAASSSPKILLLQEAFRALGAIEPPAPVSVARSDFPALRSLPAAAWSDSACLERALSRLGEEDRRILALGETARLPYAEIALALHVSPSQAAERKAAAWFALCAAMAEEAGAAANEPVALDPGDARALAAYHDGELDPRSCAGLEPRLDREGPEPRIHAILAAARQALRALPSAVPDKALFEEIELQLRRTAQRRAAFRLRLALEALALAVALALALAASVVSSPHGLDRARSWLYRRGFGAPPALPLARPGEPVAALAPIAKGAILECEGGALAYAFAGEAALRSGDALLLGPDQRAHLMLAAGGQIVAQGPCRIELESGGGALRIALESGTFWCSLPLSEAPVRFRVPGGEFDANGMEFALRAGPAAELSRLDPETKPGAAPAIPGALAAQIAIAAGRLRLGDSLAMMGETVALEEGQAPHRRDTPFRDPLVGFGQTAAQEPTFAAVERIESLKAQLKSALATEMLESLHQAVAETDLRVFFEAFIECPDTEASWYRRQLKRQIDWVAGLRIVSARQAGDRVVVRTRGAGRSAALARLVFEQRPDEKDNGKPRWTLVRFFGPGSCFDPSEAGKGEEPGDPQFDDTNPPSEIPPYEGEGKPGSIA